MYVFLSISCNQYYVDATTFVTSEHTIQFSLTYFIGSTLSHVGHERNIIWVQISLELWKLLVINNSCMNEWPWPCGMRLLGWQRYTLKIDLRTGAYNLFFSFAFMCHIFPNHLIFRVQEPLSRTLVNLDVDILINFLAFQNRKWYQ